MRVPYHIVTCLLALLCCKRFHVVEHLFSDSVHDSMNQGARCSSEPSDVHGERPVLAWSAAPFGMALWEKRKIVIDDGFLNNHPVQASSFLSMRRAQHVNGLIAMSVCREFVLMSVVFFSRTSLQSLCLASACKWLASRHSLGEVGVSVRLFSCGEEDCVLAPLRSVGARFGRSLFACLWWSARAAGALCVFAKSVWRVLCHV